MTEREDFLIWLQRELVRAERAMFDGDTGPRRRVWAEAEPVTVLGAWRNVSNRAELVDAFDELAMSFSDCTDYDLELITFDVLGDAAYTVGYERVAASVDGEPRQFTLRSTQIYRRGDDGWRVVHRHADDVTHRHAAGVVAAPADGIG